MDSMEDFGEAAADGFIDPHLRVFDQLLKSATFVSSLDKAAAYATCHSALGGFPEPKHMNSLLGDVLQTAKACIPRARNLQTVRCPELQAVALLLERLPAPQQMAWLLHECRQQLQELPLEHLLDRVRDRAMGAAQVSERLLQAQWFDPCLPPSASQPGCNLLDRFLFALIVTSTGRGTKEDAGVWFPDGCAAVSWREAFNKVPDAMIARGPTAVLASVSLSDAFLERRAAALFAALLPPRSSAPACPPSPSTVPCPSSSSILPVDTVTQAHADAVRTHLHHLVNFSPRDYYYSHRGQQSLLYRLMGGLRPYELVALAALTSTHFGLLCPHSGLPLPPTGKLVGVGYPVPARQAAERTARRRARPTAAARASLLGTCGSPPCVDPRLYVDVLLLGPDAFLNAALAPGVLLPCQELLPAPQHAMAPQVAVRTFQALSLHKMSDTSGAANVAVRDLGDAASAAAFVNAHLRFMQQHRPGVILAGREEDLLRKEAPRLLLQRFDCRAAFEQGKRREQLDGGSAAVAAVGAVAATTAAIAAPPPQPTPPCSAAAQLLRPAAPPPSPRPTARSQRKASARSVSPKRAASPPRQLTPHQAAAPRTVHRQAPAQAARQSAQLLPPAWWLPALPPPAASDQPRATYPHTSPRAAPREAPVSREHLSHQHLSHQHLSRLWDPLRQQPPQGSRRSLVQAQEHAGADAGAGGGWGRQGREKRRREGGGGLSSRTESSDRAYYTTIEIVLHH